MKIFLLLSLVMFFFSVESPATSLLYQPWQRNSSPTIMLKNFEKKFTSLPLVGQVIGTKKFWSSYYWPYYLGGINFRWNSPTPEGFNLKSPDYAQLKKMKFEERKTLSPSEKYDLFTGNYSYPLKKAVSKKTSPLRKEWEGICHGWAAAALNHNEPKPKTVKNPDGLVLHFGSSDIKALLSYYYAHHYKAVSTYQTGRRCNGQRYCDQDMNAGAFHLILTNKVGLNGESFIADIENGNEVWNQVVYNYISEIIDSDIPPSRDSAKGTVKVVRLKTSMRVVFNIQENSWKPVIGTPLQTYKTEEYEYDLDINREGDIIGGEWRSKARPDFLWLVKPTKKFDGMFSRLEELL